MLLIFFLGLITNVALFCDGCDVGTTDVTNFDWDNVGIRVLTEFMKQKILKLLLAFKFYFLVPLRKYH
jgi:hypothetical protein